nr:non-ribosomal peptide synthase-like protein [uncultured bacterium]
MPGSFDALVAESVARIRRHQPQGPYALAGHSYGGVLAAHIAARLEATGAQVQFLGVLDTVPMPAGEVPVAAAQDPLVRCMYIGKACAHAFGLPHLALDESMFRALPDQQACFALMRNLLLENGVDPAVLELEQLQMLERSFACLALLPVAALPQLRCKLEVWTSEAHEADFAQEWQSSSAGGVVSHRCQGDHLSMLHAEHGRALAQALAVAMRGSGV